MPEDFDSLPRCRSKAKEREWLTVTEVTVLERIPVQVAETILSACVDGYHPNIANKWGYVAGMALTALGRLADWTGEERYNEVVKRHMDVFIQEDGAIAGYTLEDYNLDHINKGKNLRPCGARQERRNIAGRRVAGISAGWTAADRRRRILA